MVVRRTSMLWRTVPKRGPRIALRPSTPVQRLPRRFRRAAFGERGRALGGAAHGGRRKVGRARRVEVGRRGVGLPVEHGSPSAPWCESLTEVRGTQRCGDRRGGIREVAEHAEVGPVDGVEVDLCGRADGVEQIRPARGPMPARAVQRGRRGRPRGGVDRTGTPCAGLGRFAAGTCRSAGSRGRPGRLDAGGKEQHAFHGAHGARVLASAIATCARCLFGRPRAVPSRRSGSTTRP